MSVRKSTSSKPGKILRPATIKKTRSVQVILCKNGVVKTHLVHRLVCEAFLPRRPGAEEVNHIDGNRSRNTVDNLEWVTRQENVDHAVRTGLMKRNGSDNPSARLSESDVAEIRDSRGKVTQKKLAEKFGVSWKHIGEIQNNRAWSINKA